VGWIVATDYRSHGSGEGYQYTSSMKLHATILSSQGRLQTANPVLLKGRELIKHRPPPDHILRRSSGLIDINTVYEIEFNVFRSQLFKFVTDNGLQELL